MIFKYSCLIDSKIREIAGNAVHTLKNRESGQGTTEYAILVGVLVVIAILAVTMFKDKLQQLWNDIANGINSL